MPSPQPKNLGILRPLGGGDPIPLLKDELIIGRRHSCDISLDFENISGRHCALKFINGIWHIRDLRSTNGTFVNQQRIENDHGVLPDDELKIASHLFSIDYEPTGHLGIASTNQALEGEMAEASRSLLELAGIEMEPGERRPPRHRHNHVVPSPMRHSLPAADEPPSLPATAPAKPESARSQPRPEPEPEPEFRASLSFDDDLDNLPGAAPLQLPDADEFFNIIEGDLKKPKPGSGSKPGSNSSSKPRG